MTDEGDKPPTFRRRPTTNDNHAVAEQAAQELEDLKSDKQWTSSRREVEARGGAVAPAPRKGIELEAGDEPLARVQAMVPKSLRDDFLIATRRAGTTAQQSIADFVRGYVEGRGDRR